MTSLLTSIFAIILLGVLLMAGISYVDYDAMRSSGHIRPTATHFSSMIEAAEQYRDLQGGYPANLNALEREVGLPDLPLLDGAAWTISDGYLCLSLPDNVDNRDILSGARDMVDRSQFSAECGGLSMSGKVVLSYPFAPTGPAPSLPG